MCVHRHQPICLCTFTTKVCVLRACPPKINVRTCLHCLRPLRMSIINTSLMHLWSRTKMSAFVPSTLQLMHLYTSVVNTMPSTQVVIIMCVHWQPVCLCTFTTKVCVLRACPPKPNVRTCLHCLRPLHVCICQLSTQALCIYGHVRTCQHLCLRPSN